MIKKILLIALLTIGLVSCSDDSDSPKQSFSEINAGAWYGVMKLPDTEDTSFWWVIDRNGLIFAWNGDYDGDCGEMESLPVRLVSNTESEMVFSFSEDGNYYEVTLVNSGSRIEAVIEVPEFGFSFEFSLGRDSECYSIVG